MKRPRGIFLIGYRATGKSTVGRMLASRLGWRFVDLDLVVEEKEGMKIARIVELRGWEHFRRAEAAALEEMIHKSDKTVVACGGGAVLHEALWPRIMENNMVVWLKAGVNEVVQRLGSDPATKSQRPALTGHGELSKEVEGVMVERAPLYSRFSHCSVETALRSPMEVVQSIIEEI